MSITFDKSQKLYLVLAADDVTILQKEGNKILEVDTPAYKIYSNGAWRPYLIPKNQV